MLYVIMYFFFTPLFLYIYLMLIFSHFTFDNDGMKSSKRQVTFISLILLKCFPKSTTISSWNGTLKISTYKRHEVVETSSNFYFVNLLVTECFPKSTNISSFMSNKQAHIQYKLALLNSYKQ